MATKKTSNLKWVTKKRLRCDIECCGSCVYGAKGNSLTHVLRLICTAVPDRASPAILDPWYVCDYYKGGKQ